MARVLGREILRAPTYFTVYPSSRPNTDTTFVNFVQVPESLVAGLGAGQGVGRVLVSRGLAGDLARPYFCTDCGHGSGSVGGLIEHVQVLLLLHWPLSPRPTSTASTPTPAPSRPPTPSPTIAALAVRLFLLISLFYRLCTV